MLSWCVSDLLRSLKRIRQRRFEVVVMPDFFIDRLVTYDGDLKQFSSAIDEVAERKGGNIHGVRQIELRGGNAANTAAALASLGVQVCPIIGTDSLGRHLLRFYLKSSHINLSYVKRSETVALTTALELSCHGEKVNIMLGDVGSLPDFGPKDLTVKDLQLLQQVDFVCVFNWASTSRWGTDLAETVFRHVKRKGRGKTYYDTGDPTPNKHEIPRLVRRVLLRDLVDVFSVNESEAFLYAGHLSRAVKQLRKKVEHRELAKECARILAKHMSARIDLHTSSFAGSFEKDKEVIVPTFSVSALRATGAGDAWNAGNIFGDANGLPDSCRLTLANAVAAYYVSSPQAEHPTVPKMVEFCSKQLHL